MKITTPIGIIFKTDSGYIALDFSNIPLPDSVVKNIPINNISDFMYTRFVDEKNRIEQARIDEETALLSKKRKEVAGIIYAIHVGDKIKIGRTVDLMKRLNQYERAFDNVRIISTFNSSNINHDEQTTLKYFGGQAGKREWFNYSKSLERRVQRFMDNINEKNSKI